MTTEINTETYLRINELKNFLYCPRISYYALCLRIDRETDLSRAGIVEEQVTKQRMQRRRQALHAVQDGTRHFDVSVVSHQYQVVGRLDEVVETSAGVYLVDYKDTERDYGYWSLQMLAYRLCMEEAGVNVIGVYIYTIPNRTYHEIQPKSADLRRLTQTLDSLQNMVNTEICPPPVDQIGKCRSCQYARFCNDVL
jgi:CRISPR-associated exonuclease Cas4